MDEHATPLSLTARLKPIARHGLPFPPAHSTAHETLASQAGAQVTLKPPANAKPGTGKTANVIMVEGGPAPCPKGPDGADACTVVVTGERSGDGGGGDEPSAPGKPTPGLPAYDPGRDAGSGGSTPVAGKVVQRCGGTIAGRYQADQADALAGARGTEFAKGTPSVYAGDTVHVRWSSGAIGEVLVLGIMGTRTISRGEFQGLISSHAPSPCRTSA